jgi:hypothetical protein
VAASAGGVETIWRFAGNRACALAGSPNAVLPLLALAQLFQVSAAWIPSRDGAAYLSIARSISSGDGLLRFGDPHLHFVPGYPVLIAPAFFLADRPFLWLSFLHWLFAIAFLGGAYLWFRRQSPEHALLLTVLSALNVSVLFYFRRTLSEAAFMPLLMWSAVLMDRALDSAHNHRGLLYAFVAALVAGYLCTVRLAGAALACGFALMTFYKVWAKEITAPRAAVFACLGAGIPLAAAFLWVFYDRSMSAASGQPASYYDELTRHPLQLHEQILIGTRLRLQEIGRLLIPGAFKVYGGWLSPMMLLYLPVCAAVLIGWCRKLRSQPTALLLALPFYLGLYIVWPHDQGTRFMTPMVPVLWLCLLSFAFTSRWQSRARQFAPWLILATLATSVVYLAADRIDTRKLAPYWEITDAMAKIVRPPAQIGFIAGARAFSASTFGAICTVRFERRCIEIASLADAGRPPLVDYVAVLGPPPPSPSAGFSAALQRENLTLLQRAPLGSEGTPGRSSGVK